MRSGEEGSDMYKYSWGLGRVCVCVCVGGWVCGCGCTSYPGLQARMYLADWLVPPLITIPGGTTCSKVRPTLYPPTIPVVAMEVTALSLIRYIVPGFAAVK